MKEFLRSLVALIGILFGILVILRATKGELPAVLNTLTLLFERGKARVVDTLPDSAVYLWDGLGEPFTRVKGNFLYVIDGLGEKFKWIGKNFIALFPHIAQNIVQSWYGVGAITAKVLSKIPVLFNNIGRIITRIVGSIIQFVKRIGA